MILYRYIVLQQQNISTSRIHRSQTPMDLGTSHESASNMPRSLWPAVPLGVQCSGEAEVDEQHEEAEVEEDGARGEAVEGACSAFSMRKERCVALCMGP